MNQIGTYLFESLEVRTLLINDDPHFVAKDVAVALGYKDTAHAIRHHVDDEDKLTGRITSSGQYRNMTLLNESGLYSLVLKSQLESAKRFKRWVTSEVLPDIRKHGAHMTEKTIEQALTNPDTIIQLAQNLKAEQAKREQLESQVTSMSPKARFYDRILQNKSLTPISVIAKDYGMSGIALNELLHKYGIQYKLSDTWVLYQKYADKGFTHTHTHIVSDNHVNVITKWTQKGKIFLYNELKRRGYYPQIENLRLVDYRERRQENGE